MSANTYRLLAEEQQKVVERECVKRTLVGMEYGSEWRPSGDLKGAQSIH